jgi:hypothetical protein
VLDLLPEFPVPLRYAACALHGMAGQWSRAVAGDQLAAERCEVTCLYCPEVSCQSTWRHYRARQ